MRTFLSVSILAAGLALWGGTALAESTLDKVKKTGEMLAGVRADNPPMAFRDEKGEWTGFAVDLAQAVAGKLGVKAVFVPTTAQTRTPLLTSGRIDAEFGSTTPTKQREEVVDFTIIYNWDTVVPLVRKGESKNQQSVRIELQADCFAGVWGHSAKASLKITEEDLREALDAAHAIGDDALGHQDSDDYTHGTSAQRMKWFRAGFDGGDARRCDTFAVDSYAAL